MNYERLTVLVELLNKHQGQAKEYGFIVAPHSELQLMEHKNALKHSDRIFNYHPVSDEKLCICSVTRKESANGDSSVNLDYAHDRLEHIGHEALTASELAPLLNEYMEFVKSRLE